VEIFDIQDVKPYTAKFVDLISVKNFAFLIVEIFDIQDVKPYTGDRWIGKTNFVEIRSFWHIFRSFDRMWSFYILCLQVILFLLFLPMCFLQFIPT
jgi:hypothetical protein